jgi:hypothetical protein
MQSLRDDGLFPETAQELSDTTVEWLVHSGIMFGNSGIMLGNSGIMLGKNKVNDFCFDTLVYVFVKDTRSVSLLRLLCP